MRFYISSQVICSIISRKLCRTRRKLQILNHLRRKPRLIDRRTFSKRIRFEDPSLSLSTSLCSFTALLLLSLSSLSLLVIFWVLHYRRNPPPNPSVRPRFIAFGTNPYLSPSFRDRSDGHSPLLSNMANVQPSDEQF